MGNAIGTYLGYKLIQKKWNPNAAVVVPRSWDDVKSIGIMYDATNPAFTQAVTILQNQLVSENKKVKILAFIHTKKKEQVPAAKLDVEYFSKLDTDFKGIPKGTAIHNFIQESFDYLFDLNLNQQISMHYISVLSQAKMKVGKAYQRFNPLNFNIIIEETNEQANDIQLLINNIYHYLTQLNKSSLI